MIANNQKENIDIFVICYEHTPVLERCLESISKCTTVKHKVIIVEGKRSAAENRNIALSQVTSPWFAMIDDDVVVTPNWLTTLLRHAEDKIGQIQPKILRADGRIFAAEKVFTTPWGDTMALGMQRKDKGQYDYIRVAELLSGTCSLYNSRILKTCSFDTNYKGAQWEDCDFSMQIKKNGFLLLYCGETEVIHRNLFRGARSDNLAYFKNKWFGNRRLTRRGVLYVGLACDLDCLFCYYKYAKIKTFKPLRKLKKECDIFRRFYANTHVDISGGEPAIYPQIVELVGYCRKIELAPTIITHGQRLTLQLVKELKEAGIEDLLISYHGVEKEHDYLTQQAGGYRQMRIGITNVANAGLTFRTNTVVTKFNFKVLPSLAREFLEIKPQVVNFIMFSPFEEWIKLPTQEFQTRYSDAAPYIKEAVSILDSEGIEVHVRYMPFCLSSGFEKFVMNFAQLPFDQWEWEFKYGHLLRGEYDYLYYAVRESRIRYTQPLPCQGCSLKLICSGLPKQYVRELGYQELRPFSGMTVRDPLYFNTLKAKGYHDSINEDVFKKYSTEDISYVYPWLKYSDPLILHQLTSLENLIPLFRWHQLLKIKMVKILVLSAGVLGWRKIKRKFPKFIQEFIYNLEQRIFS